ncbi:ribosome silencing factor [Campylobacter sp. MIT 99-7217]|uniref:ribosome silencing factor n=1 Tax=Campylobacter sp. MIT 99-7217 TaxID=535091 RepID=UPI001158B4D6|nr:ribosome silencing factor [Campylobacter sp. MIT 99-7217]TQR33674.1 ribosome silencing factor [Campylobacter sp. MIT 99-7217]
MQTRIDAITQILDEKKAEDIQIFDMRGKDYFTDFVILATTLTQRHALSLIDELKTKLKAKGEEFLSIESSEDWSVIDLGDIIIHLLSEQYRLKYNIEELLNSLEKQKLGS